MEGLDNPLYGLEHPYLLSVITQGWQFFKYLLLWLVPDPAWMSIDMREPFATTLTAWPMILGVVGYGAFFLAGVFLLWRGGSLGLAGLAMLAPALLFLTEFSAVRIQEQFVLYRSYLWMPLLFGLLPLLLQHCQRKLAIALLIIVPFALAALSLDRLVTFSHPILVWDDAVKLTEGRERLPGTARTIYIRGYYLNKYAFHEKAIADFDRALALRPNYPAALKERGRARLVMGQLNPALADFNQAIQIQPDYGQAYMGRAETLKKLGSALAAQRDFEQACTFGWQEACGHVEPLSR
jgi:tetratricopeptide (TPR) repeat protein